ncbi:MAG: hypothetical protein ACRDWH_02120, partial [Acidimicrobiia bacterium]
MTGKAAGGPGSAKADSDIYRTGQRSSRSEARGLNERIRGIEKDGAVPLVEVGMHRDQQLEIGRLLKIDSDQMAAGRFPT